MLSARFICNLQALRNGVYSSIIFKTKVGNESNLDEGRSRPQNRNYQYLRSGSVYQQNQVGNQRKVCQRIAYHAGIYKRQQRGTLRTHRPPATRLSRTGIRTYTRGRAESETLQRHCAAGSAEPFRTVGGGAGERTGVIIAADLCRICRKQRPKREDMGVVCLARRETAATRGGNQAVPCTCLPHGGAVLSAYTAFPSCLERAFACRYFPDDAGRAALSECGCRTFLFGATVDNARRTDLPPAPPDREKSFAAPATRLRGFADLHSIV